MWTLLTFFAASTLVSEQKTLKMDGTAFPVNDRVKKSLIKLTNGISILISSDIATRMPQHWEYRAKRIGNESPSNKLRVGFVGILQ